MRTPEQFDLYHAIEQYIRKINARDLLRDDEREELIDHLLSDAEALVADARYAL